MDRRQFLVLTSLASAVRPASLRGAPQQPDNRFDEIGALVTAKMSEYHVPGVALGLHKDGQTFIRGFGVTNVDDPQPISAETIFTIASISKTMAATAVMKLVEQGRADLKAP